MLEIKNLCAGYKNKEVLHNISFEAFPGELTAIIGPNGCGKSTLLKSIGGIIKISSGEIIFDSVGRGEISAVKWARNTAFLPQMRRVPDITVSRLVLHGRFPYKGFPCVYTPEDYGLAQKAMEKMGIEDLSDTPLNCLSGGQQQKAYIAMALCQDAPVLLADEPTNYLDISCKLQLLRYSRELADKGKYVLMVIHDLPLAFEKADKIVLMDKGEVLCCGTPGEVYDSRLIREIFGVRLIKYEGEKGIHYLCEEI